MVNYTTEDYWVNIFTFHMCPICFDGHLQRESTLKSVVASFWGLKFRIWMSDYMKWNEMIECDYQSKLLILIGYTAVEVRVWISKPINVISYACPLLI